MESRKQNETQKCQRCNGTGHVNEVFPEGHNGSFGKDVLRLIGSCPDCDGTGIELNVEGKGQ